MENNNNNRHSYITAALTRIAPGAQWVLRGSSLGGLEWVDPIILCPSVEEIETAIDEVIKDEAYYAYQEKRKAEYPDFFEYLDAVVKGDQTQIQQYIDACQAVKEKYPKPESR
jgi:hypothetical protein